MKNCPIFSSSVMDPSFSTAHFSAAISSAWSFETVSNVRFDLFADIENTANNDNVSVTERMNFSFMNANLTR